MSESQYWVIKNSNLWYFTLESTDHFTKRIEDAFDFDSNKEAINYIIQNNLEDCYPVKVKLVKKQDYYVIDVSGNDKNYYTDGMDFKEYHNDTARFAKRFKTQYEAAKFVIESSLPSTSKIVKIVIKTPSLEKKIREFETLLEMGAGKINKKHILYFAKLAKRDKEYNDIKNSYKGQSCIDHEVVENLLKTIKANM